MKLHVQKNVNIKQFGCRKTTDTIQLCIIVSQFSMSLVLFTDLKKMSCYLKSRLSRCVFYCQFGENMRRLIEISVWKNKKKCLLIGAILPS